MDKTITCSVRRPSGAWEVISREHTSASSQRVGDVQVFAHDIGGLVGQELLIELRDDQDNVLDSAEIKAS